MNLSTIFTPELVIGFLRVSFVILGIMIPIAVIVMVICLIVKTILDIKKRKKCKCDSKTEYPF